MSEGVFRAIVVGTDGSAIAERAVDRAAELAAGSQAPLHIVVAIPEEPFKERLGNSAKVAEIDLAQVAEDVLARAFAHARKHGVEAQRHARAGDPAEALLEVAEEKGADLIVVGSRGLSGPKRFLMGSVSQKVSQHAHCTVMVVRDDGAA